MHDLLIRGADVLDGTGAPAQRVDVAVANGTIAAIGQNLGDSRQTIAAAGLTLAPGFIDIHTHSDFTLPLNQRAEGKIRQGVTTEVLGNCGFSAAPALPGRSADLRNYLAASAPWLTFRDGTFAEYVDAFPPTSVNTVLQVGHNTLRLMTVGMDNRAARPDELAAMQRWLEEALDAGALGLSSGLFTVPGSYANADEIIALGHVLRRYGAAYASHIRNEAGGVFAAVDEAAHVGETCEIHVQIAHLKISGTENWGGAAKLLERIEAARRRGVRVDADQYPYTSATNPLRNLLPVWLQEGGMAAMLDRLRDRALRARIRDDIAAHGNASFGRLPSWDDVRIAVSPGQPQHAGRTIGDLARERGIDPVDAAGDYLLADEGHTRVVLRSMDEPDVRTILAAPFVFIGSDGTALAPYGVTGQGKPHPRYYGTFARVLGEYVREQRVLSLPEAVRKMTGGPAAALGLKDRGLVRQGYAADLTLFDPARVADRATYDDPHQYAAGIRAVIVNGIVAVDRGEHTGALSGRVLRRDARGVA
ncbi:MAG: D-aminoacylase [Candidatus Rokubacteria bacterium]|nr:D-aminoacylase [Candidatus Rokubacteria bacterium]